MFAAIGLPTLVLGVPGDESPLLRGNATMVDDMRSTTSIASCRVMVRLFGDGLDDYRNILHVKPTEVTDDLGHDLLPRSTDRLPLITRVIQPLQMGTGGPPALTINLRNPSRRATMIKILACDVDLYRPTEANGGLVKVTGVLAHPGAPIANDTLRANGIELTYLTESQAEQVRIAAGERMASSEAERRRLEAVAEEVARRRAVREQAAQLALRVSQDASSEAVKETVPSGSANGTAALPPHGSQLSSHMLSFQVHDPEGKVIDLELRKGDGTPLLARDAAIMSSVRTLLISGPLPPDAQLYVYLDTPAAMTPSTFRLENIALP